MKKLILLLIVSFVFTSSVSFAKIKNNADVIIVEAISIEEIQSKLNINTLANTSSNQPEPELMLNTNIGSVPIVLLDQVDVNQLELDSFATILNETAKRYNPSETLEIIVIEDEITYMYKKNDQDLKKQVVEGTFYVCETQSASQDILKDTMEPDIGTSGAIDLPGGIGGRAILTSQSSHTFSAKVYSSGFSTNGATHDNGTKNPDHLSFFNYIGLSAPFEADLGLKWSNLNGGWRPYYLCKGLMISDCVYVAGDTNTYLSNSTYPTTLYANKYENWGGERRVSISISGRMKNNSDGATVIVGATGTANNAQYKVVTTIAAKNEDAIPSGAYSNSRFTNISPLSSWASVDYDSATVTTSGSTATINVKQ